MVRKVSDYGSEAQWPRVLIGMLHEKQSSRVASIRSKNMFRNRCYKFKPITQMIKSKEHDAQEKAY